MASDFHDHFPPRANRVHEASGPSALSFAFALAAERRGPVLWVREGWRREQINPAGFGQYIDPHDLLIAKAANQTDVLAVAEEALRSGAVALMVAELGGAIGLTAGRRLQLAAEAGNTTGLCLVPEGMGSNAAQTRWHCAPRFDATDSTLQNWEIIKNKSGTLKAWDIRWHAETHRIIVVSEAGQRPVSEGAPD